METAVTIGYTEPWRQVEALLLLAADRTPALRKDPKPVVIQKSLSDFYVEYRLYAYTDDAAGWLRVLGALHANIQDAFNEFGVQILSPHYLGDPAHPAVVPKEKWHLAARAGSRRPSEGLTGRARPGLARLRGPSHSGQVAEWLKAAVC